MHSSRVTLVFAKLIRGWWSRVHTNAPAFGETMSNEQTVVVEHCYARDAVSRKFLEERLESAKALGG